MSPKTNQEKIQAVKLRKILKVLIILFGLLTICFSILTLWIEITRLFAIFFFIIEVILSKYREKLDPKNQNEKAVHKK